MESGNAHNKLSITSTASGGTGYDAVIDLLGSASNSEVQLNMGINGDADREQIKTYQSAMSFRTNNAERMRIDSSGNVGIGATSLSKLGLTGTGGLLHLGGTQSQIRLANSVLHHDNSGNTTLHLRNHYGATSNYARTKIESGFTTFHTGTSFAERMRIEAGGTVLINTTSSGSITAKLYVEQDIATANKGPVVFTNPNTGTSHRVLTINTGGNSPLIVFDKGFASKGSISTNGSSVSYNTTSDYRLKENINYTFDATTRLKQLKPARFNFIEDETDTVVDGFIAHEVSNIVPEAVRGEKDAVDSSSNPIYQEMDVAKLVPLLVKTIQELEARIATLEG